MEYSIGRYPRVLSISTSDMSTSGQTSWKTFATQGAAAARNGDIAGARAACKSCHDAWREAYKAKYRNRPIPR